MLSKHETFICIQYTATHACVIDTERLEIQLGPGNRVLTSMEEQQLAGPQCNLIRGAD